jgi:hypothetical protein
VVVPAEQEMSTLLQELTALPELQIPVAVAVGLEQVLLRQLVEQVGLE